MPASSAFRGEARPGSRPWPGPTGPGRPIRLVERYGEIGGVQVRNFLLPDLKVALAIYSNDRRTTFGEVWQGQGLSIDLIRAAVCGASSAA